VGFPFARHTLLFVFCDKMSFFKRNVAAVFPLMAGHRMNRTKHVRTSFRTSLKACSRTMQSGSFSTSIPSSENEKTEGRHDDDDDDDDEAAEKETEFAIRDKVEKKSFQRFTANVIPLHQILLRDFKGVRSRKNYTLKKIFFFSFPLTLSTLSTIDQPSFPFPQIRAPKHVHLVIVTETDPTKSAFVGQRTYQTHSGGVPHEQKRRGDVPTTRYSFT
jgi:hypothetical protein